MQSKELATVGQRTFVLVFDDAEDVIPALVGFAAAQGLTAAGFTGLGAFSRAELGFFDTDRRDYDRIPVDDQTEVLSLVGNVADLDGRPRLHAHVVLGRRDGSAPRRAPPAGHRAPDSRNPADREPAPPPAKRGRANRPPPHRPRPGRLTCPAARELLLPSTDKYPRGSARGQRAPSLRRLVMGRTRHTAITSPSRPRCSGPRQCGATAARQCASVQAGSSDGMR
jgi:uncharacterized protein